MAKIKILAEVHFNPVETYIRLPSPVKKQYIRKAREEVSKQLNVKNVKFKKLIPKPYRSVIIEIPVEWLENAKNQEQKNFQLSEFLKK